MKAARTWQRALNGDPEAREALTVPDDGKVDKMPPFPPFVGRPPRTRAEVRALWCWKHAVLRDLYGEKISIIGDDPNAVERETVARWRAHPSVLMETANGALLLNPVEIGPPEPWETLREDVVWPPYCRCGADIARGVWAVPLAVDKLTMDPMPEPGAYVARNMKGAYEGIFVVGVDEHIERPPWRELSPLEEVFAASSACVMLCRECAAQITRRSAVSRLIRECGGQA